MKHAFKTLIAVAMVAVPLTGTANALPVLPGQIGLNQLHADISQTDAFSGEAKLLQVGLKKSYKLKKRRSFNKRGVQVRKHRNNFDRYRDPNRRVSGGR